MFNNRYSLNQAVLNGSKTLTRRKIALSDEDQEYLDTAFDWDLRESVIIDRYSRYKVGEEVAVAQSYQECVNTLGRSFIDFIHSVDPSISFDRLSCSPGYYNKMFVKASFMPHRIKITDIRVERLQDISDEDCLKEGVYLDYSDRDWDEGDDPAVCYRCIGIDKEFGWPQKAYAALIDKICGRGTWDSNPYVFVYAFELVK